MDFFKGEPVTIKRRSISSYDAGNNPVWGYTTINVQNVLVKVTQAFAESNVEDPLKLVTRTTLYFPPGTALQDDDLYIVRGETYSQDGEPTFFEPSGPIGVSSFMKHKRIRVHLKKGGK